MLPPLVTIVSPVYNQENYVALCVESALAQSYPHWEQVFVDDGSDDRTLEVIASYTDPRIRVLSLPHRGLQALGESYNAALALSRGSLVAILEGDDLWPPDKLERQVPLFDDPRTVLSWGRAILVDETGARVGQRATLRDRRPVTHLSTHDAFLRLTRTNFLVPSVTVMARRSALDAIGGFQQSGSSLFVDLATWLWLTAMHEGQVTFANHVLGTYRLHARQTSRRKHAQMTREHWQVVECVAQTLDPLALDRAGWNADARLRAFSRGMLAEGETALSSATHGTALRIFRDAFRLGAPGWDRLLALLGMASAATRLNLVATAFALRERIRR